jgi:ADP-heptose:LPS heptosyltransferase
MEVDAFHARMADFESVLLARPVRSLGDMLMVLPGVDYFREQCPNARIDIVVERHMAPILEGEGMRQIYTYDHDVWRRPWELVALMHRIRKAHYDLAVDCGFGSNSSATFAAVSGATYRIGAVRSGTAPCFHLSVGMPHPRMAVRTRWTYFTEQVGLPRAGDYVQMHLTDEEDAWAEQWYAEQSVDLAAESVVIVAPGGRERGRGRRWPWEKFLEVSHEMAARGHRIVFLLGPEEAEFLPRIQAEGPEGNVIVDRQPLRKAAALLSKALLYIGCDSGAAHLAGSVGTPILVIFCVPNYDTWGPHERQGSHYYDPGDRPLSDLYAEAESMLANPPAGPPDS